MENLSKETCVNGKWREQSGRAKFRLNGSTVLVIYKTRRKIGKRIYGVWLPKVTITIGRYEWVAYGSDAEPERDAQKAKGKCYDVAMSLLNRLKEEGE
jgi:hypothetical protein